MGIWDYIRRRVAPKPSPAPKPVTPPTPPPIDPEVARKRAEAMNRRAADSLKFKKFQSEAMSTGFLPPAPPSIDWYVLHPDYVWNPYEPNPELPPPVVFPKSTYAILVNGIPTSTLTVLDGTSEAIVTMHAMNDKVVQTALAGHKIVRTDFSDGKSINFIAVSSASAQQRHDKDLSEYLALKKKMPAWIMVYPPPLVAYYIKYPDYVWDYRSPTPHS